jgi:hypothetical protein
MALSSGTKNLPQVHRCRRETDSSKKRALRSKLARFWVAARGQVAAASDPFRVGHTPADLVRFKSHFLQVGPKCFLAIVSFVIGADAIEAYGVLKGLRIYISNGRCIQFTGRAEPVGHMKMAAGDTKEHRAGQLADAKACVNGAGGGFAGDATGHSGCSGSVE